MEPTLNQMIEQMIDAGYSVNIRKQALPSSTKLYVVELYTMPVRSGAKLKIRRCTHKRVSKAVFKVYESYLELKEKGKKHG